MQTTTAVPVSLQETYALLEETARLLGLPREIRLIQQRKHRLTAPFTMGVVGPAYADVPLIVDILLGRSLATRLPEEIGTMVFQAAEEEDVAECYYRGQKQPERLPHDVAIQRLGAGMEVEKIVWHCTHTRLPAHVRVVQTIVRAPYTAYESLMQDVDALLVALPIERTPVALPMLEALSEMHPPVLPVMGVVTRMEHVPTEMWEEVLRRLRQKTSEHVSQLIPLAHTDDLVKQPPRGGAALYRAVKTHFFASNHQLRETVDHQVVGELKERILEQTEQYMDRAIEGYRVWSQEWARVEEELEQRRESALEQGSQFIQQLQEQAEERARLLEQGIVSDAPLVIGEQEIRRFLGSIQGHLIQVGATRIERMASHMLSSMPGAIKRIDVKEYLHHLYHIIPAPPVEVFSMLTRPVVLEAPVESALFVHGKGQLHEPREVAIWQHGREWVRKVAEQVRGLYRRWVLGMYDRVREQVKLQFDKLFRFFFHTTPEYLADHLVRVEQLYEKIRGKKSRIPAPHLGIARGLSPAEFLLKTQDDHFVRTWNHSWKMYCWKDTSYRIHRWGREQIRSYRETLREEWQQAWDALHAYVAERWHREGWRLLLKGEVRWSFQEVLSRVLRNRTPVPEQDLRLPPFGLEAEGIPFASLYLRERGENFLQKQGTPEQIEVNRELQRRLVSVWKKHLVRLSGQDFYIRLVLPVRKWVMWSGIGLTLLFVGLLFSGVNAGVFFLLFALASTGGIAAAWLLPEIVRERGFSWMVYQQTDRLYQLIDRILKDMLTRVEQEIVHELKDEGFEETMLKRIPEEVPGGFRFSYGTLQQRLVQWPAAA